MGPLLFILFINDLVDHVDQPLFMYADDTTALVGKSSTNTMEECCNLTLQRLTEWFASNRLVMNPQKTMYARYHNSHCALEPMKLSVNSGEISSCASTKFLGIHIDEKLTWEKHCVELCKTLNSLCYQVRNLKSVLTLDQLRSFYFASVQSRLCYGICFWGASPGSRAVFVAQKRIIRVIAGSAPGSPCRVLFSRLRLLPLPCLHIQELAIFTFNNKHEYQIVSQVHSYPTRNKNNIYVDSCRLTVSCKSPSYLGASVYNRLPADVRTALSFNSFKNKLKLFLLSKLYYALDEFFHE